MKKNGLKFLKVCGGIVLGLLLMNLVLYGINFYLAKQHHAPILCWNTKTYLDGGTKEYMCLGYKVIDYHQYPGYEETQIGSFKLQYQEYHEVETHLVRNITKETTFQHAFEDPEIIDEITDYIQKNIDATFDIKDYQMSTSQNVQSIFFNFYPYGIKTQNNYTIVVRNDSNFSTVTLQEIENSQILKEKLAKIKLFTDEEKKEVQQKLIKEDIWQITKEEYLYRNQAVYYRIELMPQNIPEGTVIMGREERYYFVSEVK